ncbi:hypothetical protein AX16_006198 [Volvariella volvacea WC 439]|nr:hypothetical protein AX16_006198 [Volvariella volvacea WC 439]
MGSLRKGKGLSQSLSASTLLISQDWRTAHMPPRMPVPVTIFAESKAKVRVRLVIIGSLLWGGHTAVARREASSTASGSGKSRTSSASGGKKEKDPYTISAYGTLNEEYMDPIRTNLRPPKARQTRVYRIPAVVIIAPVDASKSTSTSFIPLPTTFQANEIAKYTTSLREPSTNTNGTEWNWRKEHRTLLRGGTSTVSSGAKSGNGISGLEESSRKAGRETAAGSLSRSGSSSNVANDAAGSLVPIIATTPSKGARIAAVRTHAYSGLDVAPKGVGRGEKGEETPDFDFVSPYPRSPSSKCGLRSHEKLFLEFYSDYKIRASMTRY